MSTIREQYASHVAAGEIERDPAQETVVARLDAINARLATHRLARKSSSLGWLFGNQEAKEAPLKGLYVWGDVGLPGRYPVTGNETVLDASSANWAAGLGMIRPESSKR